MPKHLIYLHIPKSAGTSQRVIFYQLYGEDNVFWYGLDAPANEKSFQSELVADYSMIGGHPTIEHYPRELDAIYLSAVREPVSRVVSLYSYYVKPMLAEARGRGTDVREEQRATWLGRGMDENSLLRSLENCDEFRQEVTNSQCRYLSRGPATFDGVLNTLQQTQAVVGELEKIDMMNQYLAKVFEWPMVPRRKLNRSVPGSHRQLIEDGLEEVLHGLLEEDRQLYRYISQECDGLFTNLSENFSLPQKLRPTMTKNQRSKAVKVQIYGKGYIGIRESGVGATGVVLFNNNDIPLDPDLYPHMGLCVDILDNAGQCILLGQLFQPVFSTIEPDDKLLCRLNIDIPVGIIERAHTLSVRFTLVPEDRAENQGSLHGASLALLRI